MTRAYKTNLIVLALMAYTMFALTWWASLPTPMQYDQWLLANCPRILANEPFQHPTRLDCWNLLRRVQEAKEARRAWEIVP